MDAAVGEDDLSNPVMSVKIIIGLLVSLVFWSCIKTSERRDDYISLTYDQTQCADQWGYGSSDNLTIGKVKHYLDSLQLFYHAVTIQTDPSKVSLCNACTCTTGKVFFVTTRDDDALEARYAQIGFK